MSVVASSVLGMRDLGEQGRSGGGDAVVALPPVGEILDLAARVAVGDGRHLSDAERIDYLRAATELTCALQGSQAQVTHELATSQRADQAREGVRAERRTRGIAAQVGLARRGSHHRGQRWVHLAERLVGMPDTFAVFRAGRIDEFKASLITRVTECLTPEVRAKVDMVIASDPDWLESLSDRQLEAEVSKLAYRFDPQSFVKRAAKAAEDRRVTTRPAPDTMLNLTALLPVVPGVTVYAVLLGWAKSQKAAGDPRSINQLMADRLVELVTGRATAEGLPIAAEIQIADTSALGVDDEPAWVAGYGPIPAQVACALIATASDAEMATLRRLYTHPATGRLVAMESVAREFPQGLAGFLRRRDQGRCRTSWCGAPIRASDHPKDWARGGETTGENGQGLCEACNIAKEAPGWRARPRPGPAGQPDLHTIETTTPTGHVYVSVAPQIGIVRRPLAMEIYLAADFAAA